jgi:hypothetical protein
MNRKLTKKDEKDVPQGEVVYGLAAIGRALDVDRGRGHSEMEKCWVSVASSDALWCFYPVSQELDA